MGIWLQRMGWAAAALIAATILGFYVSRLGMPMPIYAPDEGAYLIRALYPPQVALSNELLAIAMIALVLPSLIVGWLVMTHVIGRGKSA